MYDFAQKISGDKVTVAIWFLPGPNPTTGAVTTDITNLEDTDVFIYSGAGMEH